MGSEMQSEWDLGVKAACLATIRQFIEALGKPHSLQLLGAKQSCQCTGFIQSLKPIVKVNYQTEWKLFRNVSKRLMQGCMKSDKNQYSEMRNITNSCYWVQSWSVGLVI